MRPKTDANARDVTRTLLPLVANLLSKKPHDAFHLLSLARKLIRPLSWKECSRFTTPGHLCDLLKSPLPVANLVAVDILASEDQDRDKMVLLHEQLDLVDLIEQLLFTSPDIAVSEAAARVLVDLLYVDCPATPERDEKAPLAEPTGPNVLWNHVFRQRTSIAHIVDYCSTLGKTNSAIAQARLLAILPDLVARNPWPLTSTDYPDLFPVDRAVSDVAGIGLLQWAAFSMVDGEDVLMSRYMNEFWPELVVKCALAPRSDYRDRVVRDIVRVAIDGQKFPADELRNIPLHFYPEEEDEGGVEAQGRTANPNGRAVLTSYIEYLLQQSP